MGSFSEEELRFFDANEDIASVSDSSRDSIEVLDTSSSGLSWVRDGFPYDVWARSPGSVRERRVKFLDWMEVSVRENLVRASRDVLGEISRVRESSGAVLRSQSLEDEFSSSRSSMSFWGNEFRDGSSSVRMEFNGDGEEGEAGKISEGREVNEVSQRTSFSSSTLSRQLSERQAEEIGSKGTILKRVKKKWLRRFRSMTRSMTCLDARQGIIDRLAAEDEDTIMGIRSHRVKVRHSRKRLKELSALYMGQDIQAHEGSILAMKFSPDGQYLASAGVDGIVRVWQVVENQRCNELDIPEIDPSCIYFTVNHLSELNPLFTDKEKVSKSQSMRRTSDSACVIFPPKVFRIVDKPLHEFHGHRGDILDLSWSRNNYLLSSSVDKTVRLWQVGCTDCLRVFAHSNYVTCVQFNPVDDNYFISGSIDGKVRIWGIPCCQVVDYSDVRDIVSAVCYRPDGQGAIVGSMTGICRLYNISDNHLQMDAEICLYSKKKAPCKKITGFEFFPQDPSKVMVTCADSQVRILHGLNVIGKYKGLRNTANLRCATFTSDGKHIISASEDSNVYIWNCSNQEKSYFSQVKSIKSCERFTTDASIAISWSGLKREALENAMSFGVVENNLPQTLPFPSPSCFSLSQESLLESIPKGSATWPEEKLPTSSPLRKSSTMHRSEYKFFKTSCQSTLSSHAWGMVIVTAGWDGRIKSFHNYGLPVPV